MISSWDGAERSCAAIEISCLFQAMRGLFLSINVYFHINLS